MGAGGCGREVLQWAKDINSIKKTWDEFAFLDYDTEMLDGKNCDAKIISNDDTYEIRNDDDFICAVGNGSLRKKIIEKMESRGAKFINLIHPTAEIADSVIFNGCGIVVYPHTIITANTVIGKGCIINMNCTIAHDVVMGEYCTISPACNITGICTLGNNVFMGVGSHIIPSITLGDNIFVCAGSTIMTNFKKECKVIGTPARKAQGWS